MFIRQTSTDVQMICRGLMVLVVVIILGVTCAEKQLNSLTERQDFVEVLNIRHDKMGLYSVYVLGDGFSFSAVYPIAKISNNDRQIILEVTGQKLVIPTCIYIDSEKIVASLNVWFKQFVMEAFKTKHSLGVHGKELYEKIAVLIRQLR